jgi:hypothetical protein
MLLIATTNIAREIGISQAAIDCIEAIGFSHTIETLNKHLVAQIGCYSDMRVAPHGVLSLRERIEEAHRRYMIRGNFNDPVFFERARQAFEQMEIQIFRNCRLRPDEISDAFIAASIEELKKWSI